MMHHARCVTLPRKWPTLPCVCGVGEGCSIPALVRLWASNRFQSWLLVLARGIDWPQAGGSVQAPRRPGTLVLWPSPERWPPGLCWGLPFWHRGLSQGRAIHGLSSHPYSTIGYARANPDDGYGPWASPRAIRESIRGSLGLPHLISGLSIPLRCTLVTSQT
jgi:hypothetical protein